MKQLKAEQWAVVGLILAALGYVGFELAARTSPNADMPNPQRQPLPDDYEAALRLGQFRAIDGHSVLCHPEDHHGGYTYTPHRYPRTVGGEVTNAIHRGFSSMRIPTDTADVQWIISPPSEAAW